jgi:hypothetical protein
MRRRRHNRWDWRRHNRGRRRENHTRSGGLDNGWVRRRRNRRSRSRCNVLGTVDLRLLERR